MGEPSPGTPPPVRLPEDRLDSWKEIAAYLDRDVTTVQRCPLPALTLTRGARHLAFLPGGRELVVLRGEIQHKNLWLLDLETGAQRQLTNLSPDFDIRDFDLSRTVVKLSLSACRSARTWSCWIFPGRNLASSFSDRLIFQPPISVWDDPDAGSGMADRAIRQPS
jgi:hypothetical protein